jgi:formate dehydrogenase subunit delta
MIIEKLVRMTNQIADNFAYLPDPEQAALKVADHLQRFWDPTMRAEIIEYLEAGGSDLSEIGKVAVSKISAG